MNKARGFTIVELLVVIVIIGTLATITIVSYTGITSRAAIAALKSDLKNASTQLELDKAENGAYPENEAASNDGKGLPTNSDTDFQYTLENDQYYLSATSENAGVNAFHVTSITGSIENDVWENHIPPSGIAPYWRQIATGDSYTCGISSSYLAYCWGLNTNGRLGNNSTTQSLVPVAVNTAGVLNGKTVKSITAGVDHVCAIASDDLAYCWGKGSYGRLGNDSTGDSLVPVAVNTAGVLSGKTIKSIKAGGAFTCAVASNDLAYCWGYNGNGALGNNSTTESHVPVAVTIAGNPLSGKTMKSITTGDAHVCALASDNQAYCWGYNANGRLGNNSTTQSLVAVAVNTAGVLSGKTVLSVKAGSGHNCAIASDNQAYCWGYGGFGQLGYNSTTQSLVPVAVIIAGTPLSGKTVKTIGDDDSGMHTCIIASDDLAYCWGAGNTNDGQLGNNSTAMSLVPVAVDVSGVLNGKTVKSIDASLKHTCAIASDNQAYCWGLNANGQLGNNSTTRSLVPIATISPTI